MFKTAIFDLDGTLLDTLDDLTDAVNASLKAFALPTRTKEEVCSFVGNGIGCLIKRAIGENNADFEAVLNEFKKYYGKHCKDKTKPYKGIILLLSALKARGVQTAILSNKADFAVQTLSKEYFGNLINVAQGENETEGVAKKPDAGGVYAIMKKLGARAEETVFVGDSDVDIRTAENAKIECIAVTWGFRDEQFLRKQGAKTLVSTPLEILRYCNGKGGIAVCDKKLVSEQMIGKTPLVRLKNIEKKFNLNAKLFAKAENFNAGGSIKDRVALAIINDAEKSGRLQKGGMVIEATSGNTGIGLALVCALRGYKAVIVMPETMTEERRKLIASYGAEIVLTDGEKGMQGAVEKAEELLKNSSNAVIAGQFFNPVCVQAHYDTTAVELYEGMKGKIDAFVAGVGTGGTLTGVGKFLKERNAKIRVVAVEPTSSPLLSKGYAGAHGIQGIGANFLPDILDKNVYDEIITVDDNESVETAKIICQEEGLFVGISSGANLAAVIQMARKKENAGKNIVTVFPDSGDRYLSIF